jgi:hypothetical protein
VKRVSRDRAIERLLKAQAYRKTAGLAAEFIEDLSDPDPISSNAVLAVIAFTDAITIAVQEQISQDDHAAAIKLLRDCLGNALPGVQERNLQKLLAIKGEVQYGARRGRSEEARLSIRLMDEFAEWAIGALRDRGVSLD